MERQATFSPSAAWRIAWPIAVVAIGLAVLLVVATIADGAGASSDTTTALGTFIASGAILLGGLALIRALPPAQRRVTLQPKGRPWAGAAIGIAVGLACVVGSGLVIAGGTALDPSAKRALDDLDVSVEIGRAHV